jgi:hypothetical protein
MSVSVAPGSQVSDALKLEEIAFNRSMSDAAAETNAAVKALERELAASGLRNSGPYFVRDMEIRFAKFADGVIEKAITKRKELGRRFPDLLKPPRLDQLRDKLLHYVDGIVSGEQARIAMGGRSYGAASASLNQQAQMKANVIKARITQELEALRLEARLGMHTEEKPVTILNISDSTIASLNLGTVVGDLTASVQTLNNQGQKEFAHAIQALAEGLAASAELQADHRKELLEHLAFLSAEVASPPEKRKMGPLKSSIAFLRARIADVTQLASLWSAVEQVLKTMGIIS